MNAKRMSNVRARFTREDDAKAWARAVHQTRRRWFITLFGNAALFGLMLGVPYARGLMRAEDIRRGYANAVACLLGGQPAPVPGIGALDDEAGRLAANMLTRDPRWLARCDGALARIAPPSAMFVWPAAKEGEARVREAVQILRRELSVLRKLPQGQRLPIRPVRALAQLDQALSQHAVQTGALNIPPQAAVLFTAAAPHPTPARLPLYASTDAALTLWGNDSELYAVAVDRTGLSYLHADKGGMQRARHVRPKLLQSFMRQGDVGYLAYAISAQKCREREGGCAKKSMGLARVTLPLTNLPEPRWLASHPAHRLDQSLRRTTSGWWVAAATELGQAELRQLYLPEEIGGGTDTTLPPVPLRAAASQTVQQVLFLEEATNTSALGAALRDGESVLIRMALADTPEVKLASLPNAHTAWAAACSSEGSSGLMLGSGSEVLLGTLQADTHHVWPKLPLDVTAPFHEKDPNRDAVVPVCLGDDAQALALDDAKHLWSVFCAKESKVCTRTLVAEQVDAFSVTRGETSVVVAYAGADDAAQIRIQRFDLQGRMHEKARVPSACWAPKGGMCGPPLLTRIGMRMVLTAREGTDMLMLESPDDGLHWQPLAHDGQVHL